MTDCRYFLLESADSLLEHCRHLAEYIFQRIFIFQKFEKQLAVIKLQVDELQNLFTFLI